MSDLANKPLVNVSPNETMHWPSALVAAMRLHGMSINKLIPATILEFDRNKNLASVQPQIMILDVSDNTRARQPIANVPVLSLGGGGFHISFPLKAGDFGWILAADRDISQFTQNLKSAPPNTLRNHSFADSWFIPDVFRNYTVNSSDSNAMVIQSVDGTTRISISEGQVNIFAPSSVTVTTPQATFTQNVSIGGTLTVAGLTTVNGGFTALGTGGNQPCTLPQSTTIGGIAVYGHGHISSNPGTRTSGGMIS